MDSPENEERTVRQVHLIVMHGAGGGSEIERTVNDARRAIARDTVDKALDADAFATIVVSTNDRRLMEAMTGTPRVVIEPDPEGESFHFGRRLQALVSKHQMERVVYVGGGSAPLLPVPALRGMVEQVRQADRLLVANNFYSVDFCGITPASALLSVEPPSHDNGLGWTLREEAGLPARELPRQAGSVFDVDTPIDLLVLSLHPDVPARTRTYLAGLKLDTRHVEAASAVFVQRGVEALVAGRISSSTLAYLERETLCRTRVFSEERGMRADGRQERGEVRSLLALQLESAGIDRFFDRVIPQLGQAAFIDDRVLWAHRRLWPAASDRFNSDLLRPEAVADPWLRRFTQAAALCPVPVVLGGHSLVAGGMYVLVEAAWARSGLDVQRTLAP
jgi:hypothetical protein